MREIKFRAWNKNAKDYETGWATTNVLDIEESGNGFGIMKFPEHKDIILMQYTGLKDKNGKEIYEGDIVRNIYPGGEKIYGVVGWPQCIDCKETYELAGSTYKKMMSFTDCEVIGNIYENPNLI